MLAGTDLWITSVSIDLLGLNSLGFFGLALILVAVVELTNAFNMADGIDGIDGTYDLVAGHAMTRLILVGSTM